MEVHGSVNFIQHQVLKLKVQSCSKEYFIILIEQIGKYIISQYFHYHIGNLNSPWISYIFSNSYSMILFDSS